MDNFDRKRAVVLTSKKPLDVDAILKSFSKADHPVKDYRWEKANRHVGILQFHNV